MHRLARWLPYVAALLLAFQPATSFASTVINPDTAWTDADTPLLIDVLANDEDSEGRPMVVSVTSEDCPGTVERLFDDTLLYDPTEAVSTTTTCTIAYSVAGLGNSTVQLTVLPGDGTGGGGGGGNPPSGPCGGGWSSGLFQPAGGGFIYQDQPITLAGYYPGLHTLSRQQFDSRPPTSSNHYVTLIDHLVERNINLLRVALTNHSTASNHGGYVHPYAQSAQCCTVDPPASSAVTWNGGSRFDLSQFNPEFFAHWRNVLQYAENRGVMVIVSLFDAAHQDQWDGPDETVTGGTEPLREGRRYDYLSPGNNVNGIQLDSQSSPQGLFGHDTAVAYHRAFARKAAEELGDFDNVIWQLANALPTAGLTSGAVANWTEQVCEGIRQGESAAAHPRHAVMPADLPGFDQVPGSTTPGQDTLFGPLHQALTQAFSSTGPALISDNGCCRDAGDIADQRRKAWTSLVSGAYPLLHDYKADGYYGQITHPDRLQAMEWVGRLRQLNPFSDISFQRMVPRNDLISTSDQAWLLAQEGAEYIVYFPEPGSATLQGVPDGLIARWYEPRSGAALIAAADVPGTRTYSTPSCGDFNPVDPTCNGTSDWVLQIADFFKNSDQEPYGGVPHVLGQDQPFIEAEHYDVVRDDQGQVLPGQDVAYFDTTEGNVHAAQNPAGAVRPDEWVDAGTFGPTGVSHTANGEWLEYTVQVPQAGPYAFYIRYATELGKGDGSVRLDVYDANGGETPETTFTVPLTSTHEGDNALDWRYFVHCVPFDLTAGPKVLRLTFVEGTVAFDHFQLMPAAHQATPYAPLTLPGQIEAEHFDRGGTAGYCDNTPANLSNQSFRQDDWVDLPASGGSYVIAYIAEDEWVRYTAQLAAAGTYTLEVRYATLNNVDGNFHVTVHDATTGVEEASQAVFLPNNSPQGPGPYEVVTVGDVTLSAGTKVITVTFQNGGYAFDWLSIGEEPPPGPPVAGPNSFSFPMGEDYDIPVSALLANDDPRELIEIDTRQPIVTFPTGSLAWDGAGQRYIYSPGGDIDQYPTQFTYRIRRVDDWDQTADGVVTLTPVGDVPVAANLTYTAIEGLTLRFQKNELTGASSGEGIRFGNVLTAPPGLVEDGSFIDYTPPIGVSQASFTYDVVDIFDVRSAPGTVTFNVVSAPPEPIGNPDVFEIAERELDGDLVILKESFGEFIGNDQAINGGSLTIHAVTQPPAGQGSTELRTFGIWYHQPNPPVAQATFGYKLVERPPFGPDIPAQAEVPVTVKIYAAPEGMDDMLTTPAETSLLINISQDLMHNDNGHGSPLHLVPELITAPAQGTLDTSQPGFLTYSPNPGHSGADTFTYVLANSVDGVDEDWATRSAPVTVTVNTDPPDAAAADDTVLIPSGASHLDIPLTSLWQNDSPADELVIESLGSASWGMVTQQGSTLRYTPTEAFWRYGFDTFEYEVRRAGGNPNIHPEATVTVRSHGDFSLVLGDEFEGDLSAWDRVAASQGHSVTVSPQSAITGFGGLRVELGGAVGSAFVESTQNADATHVSISFWLDSSELELQPWQGHPLLTTGFGALWLKKILGDHKLRVYAYNDAGASLGGQWITLEARPYRARVEIQAASLPGMNDGYARLYLDDILVNEVVGVDSDQKRYGLLRLGAVWGLLESTFGSTSYDGVEIHEGPASKNVMLSDDFSSGDFSAWKGSPQSGGTLAIDGQGRLAVTPAGAGSYAYLYSDDVTDSSHFATRLLLDAGSLNIGPNDNFFFLVGSQLTTTAFALRLGHYDGEIRLAISSLRDTPSWANTAWIVLPRDGQAHEVGLEWWASSAPGADDGGARLSLDGVVASEALGIDNDTRKVHRVTLGAPAAVDAGTVGTFYVDDVDIWRGPQQRQHLAVDDFENGFAPDWSVIQAGGTVTTAPVSAFGGSHGAVLQVNSGAGFVGLRDDGGDNETSHIARFRWDASGLQMADGDHYYAYGLSRPNWWVASLHHSYTAANGHQLRMVAARDTTYAGSPGVVIDPSVPHDIVFQWWAASGPDAADGGARWWLDGVLAGEILGLDNDQQYVDRVQVGAVAAIDAGTSGTVNIDDFESWR